VITLLLVYVVELLVLISPFIQNVITHSQKKSEKLKAVVSGHQELATKEKCISEERTKNCYLQRELDMLKQERTRETWLLKNDLAISRRPTPSSRNNSRDKRRRTRSNSKNRRRRTKVSPYFPRVLSLNNLSWILKISSPQSLEKP
jgi:hypothetical protein